MRRYPVKPDIAQMDAKIVPTQLKQEIITIIGLSSPEWSRCKEALLELIIEIDEEQAKFDTFDDYYNADNLMYETKVRL